MLFRSPSSWRTSIRLLGEGTVVPEKIVSRIVSLEDWREGFEMSMRGEGVKAVICCDPALEGK